MVDRAASSRALAARNDDVDVEMPGPARSAPFVVHDDVQEYACADRAQQDRATGREVRPDDGRREERPEDRSDGTTRRGGTRCPE
ncbi:hypothetical protein ACF09K_25690 [Streptomyces sp. NPDC014882]|uniref:hypothetical protein n=1 Tax=Streptomyces sp. NPDC014882 TaxID=3364927 RepID=UPI0036FEDFA4